MARASAALTRGVLDHPTWQSAGAVAAFVGVAGEPDTRPLLEAALARGRGLWLPRVLEGRAGVSQLVKVEDLDVLAPAGFGLLEPRPRANEITTPAFDPAGPITLVLVPGLAFTRSGARLGFGAGHYDRLLAPAAHASTPVRMGLCFSAFVDPVEGPFPIETHDVAMHWLATEAGVLRCGEG